MREFLKMLFFTTLFSIIILMALKYAKVKKYNNFAPMNIHEEKRN